MIQGLENVIYDRPKLNLFSLPKKKLRVELSTVNKYLPGEKIFDSRQLFNLA